MKFKITFVFLFLCGTIVWGQNLNSYKYVIVPDYYTFLKGQDQYQLNSLTKFLFNKYGFEAYLINDEYPVDLLPRSCKALYANVESETNFLITKLKVTLSDCEGEVLYISEVGRSKEKEYKKAYHLALRAAFESIQELKYIYKPEKEDTTVEAVNNEAVDQGNTTVKTPPVVSKKVEQVTVVEDVVEKTEETVIAASSTTQHVYKSANSSYSIHKNETGYTIYDGDQKIGNAKETSTGVYLIQTTDFNGIGRITRNSFIVERSIKGVDELVKMTFTLQ